MPLITVHEIDALCIPQVCSNSPTRSQEHRGHMSAQVPQRSCHANWALEVFSEEGLRQQNERQEDMGGGLSTLALSLKSDY